MGIFDPLTSTTLDIGYTENGEPVFIITTPNEGARVQHAVNLSALPKVMVSLVGQEISDEDIADACEVLEHVEQGRTTIDECVKLIRRMSLVLDFHRNGRPEAPSQPEPADHEDVLEYPEHVTQLEEQVRDLTQKLKESESLRAGIVDAITDNLNRYGRI